MKVVKALIIHTFFITISTFSFSMDNGYTFYGNALASSLEAIVNNVNSLKNTVVNALSDEAAFIKLGWPTDNAQAQQELKRCQEVYKRYKDYMVQKIEYLSYAEDKAVIERRVGYCKRVLEALRNNTIVNYTDRPKLALHCLEYHKEILSEFDKNLFLTFIKVDQKKMEEEIKKNNEMLKKLNESENSNK